MKKGSYGIYLLAILFLGFFLRVFLYRTGTFFIDVNSFIAWSNTLVEGGFKNFYLSVWSDYLPGYLYVLWFLGKLGSFVHLDQLFLFKLPAIASDLATGYLIYLIVKKIKSPKAGLIASAFYIFNPALIFNSTLWGQVDSLTALFYLLSIYLIGVNSLASALVLSIGSAFKPQVALAAPIVLMLMLKNHWNPKKIMGYILLSAAVFLLIFLPFNLPDKNPLIFVFERIGATLNQYPYGSVNAFNFWGLWGFWKPDSLGIISPKILGFVIFGVISFLSFIRFSKKEGGEYHLAAIFMAANFLFFTRMHERHLLGVFAPLVISASLNPLFWVSYLGFSSTYVLNLSYAFEQQAVNKSGIFTPVSIQAMIFLNLIFFVLLFVKNKLKIALSKSKAFVFEKTSFSNKHLKILLFIILAFSLLSRTLWLGSPKNEYFDEVYHAFTARTILHGDSKAWEWWNTPPEGFAYEWTHPPLAKLGMVVGMLIFGENSFGWRIPGAILGAASVFLVYLIGKRIFKDEVVGLLAAGVFSLDGLALVMSRIGMNDSYLLFFVLLSFYLFLRDKNFLSALAFGFAISSKWSAVWVIPIFLLAQVVLKKKISLSYLWFLILPPLVYLANYIPMFLTGHDLSIFWGMQKQMWWYHINLKATHPYTSPWWSWPFLARPIYLYTSDEVGGIVSRIYAMGNPLVVWGGLISTAVAFYFAVTERAKKLAFVVFSYLVLFAGWALSPRIMFLYHYLPSVPFLAVATGYILRRFPKIIPYFFVAGLILFVYFYPHWIGLPVSLSLDKSYYWFASWR